MLGVLTLASASFQLLERSDPITLDRQAIYGTADGGNTFGLVCRPGKGEISAIFIPKGYYMPENSSTFFDPKASSRFGNQSEAENDAWYFDEGSMSYISSNLFKMLDRTARFIDLMAKDGEFNIRFMLAPSDVRTVTINYSLDQSTLRRFVQTCGPKKVIAKLREMKSPAAPDH